ncbi:MAG: hypothetical protein INQ03_14915 [Candidatus Heimdallarchaeota archaeon]|nr:hypothetical protein [Candidatus Heimdallarchaeota archaeon]
MDSTFKALLEESRAIAIKLYMSWLESHGILELIKSPITIPSIYYEKKWNSTTQEAFELMLAFLSSMKLFSEAGGTFVLNEKYHLLLEKINHNHPIKNLQNNPIWVYITYALNLFDERNEGGSGTWNKNKYHILEQFYSSELYKLIFVDLVKSILIHHKNEDFGSFRRIVVISLYNDLAIDTFVNQNSNPDHVRLVSFTDKLKRLSQSYCELSNERSQYSSSLRTLDETMDLKADLVILPNGLGMHQSIKDLAEYIDKISNEKCTVAGISSLRKSNYIGVEPLWQFHSNFVEYPEESHIEKQLIRKGFGKLGRFSENTFIFSSRRITR